MVNNLDWLGEWSLIDFLRDVGKHFTIPYMLAKDSVQTRLERGLSFTEFSYMLLQADDFAHLHRTMGVELQMGGADQWGNITAGLELIRRTNAAEGSSEDQEPAHGLAYKLLLSPSGTKFGKSETGESVWLDPRPDLALCVLPVLAQHRRSRRRDLPALVHRVPAGTHRGARERGGARARGPAARSGRWRSTSRPGPTATRRPARAVADSEAKFSSEADRRSGGPALAVSNRPAGSRSTPAGLAAGTAVVLAEAGLVASKGEARRLIAGGGVTVNGDAGDRPGLRPGADRRGVARRADRQAPARDRPRGGLGRLGVPFDGTRIFTRQRPVPPNAWLSA